MDTSMRKETDSMVSQFSDSYEREIVWAKLNSLTKRTVASVKIKAKQFSIGRHPSNDLQIVDARLSGVHCKIKRY